MTIDYSRANRTVAKRIDLCIIEQKINCLVYKCYEAFLSDIKWMVHNVKVHYHSSNKTKSISTIISDSKMSLLNKNLNFCFFPLHFQFLVVIQKHWKPSKSVSIQPRNRFTVFACVTNAIWVWLKVVDLMWCASSHILLSGPNNEPIRIGRPNWCRSMRRQTPLKCAILVENICGPFCRQRNAFCTPNWWIVQVRGSVHTKWISKKLTRQLLYYFKTTLPFVSVFIEFNFNYRFSFSRSLDWNMQEADLYIMQLRKKYGTFNLAAVNTPLNAHMLERHLYDTIPQAWVALGGTKTPPPIPKPYGAAAATISRRHSIADSSASRPPSPSPIPSPSSSTANTINFRGITLRRMSTRLNDTDEDSETTIRNIITRRQSIQVDMLRGPSTSGMSLCSHFSPVHLSFAWN